LKVRFAPMKKKSEQPNDELRPEYDFRSLRVVARGPGRKKPKEIIVHLAPDVAAVFPDSGAVKLGIPFHLSLIARPRWERQ
jgi:hypothetical protein